jgi:hypothetical protein
VPPPERRRLAQARAAKNQQLFRELNSAISKLRYSSAFNEYVCECGRKTCLEVIHLSHDEFDEIRQEPNRFVVLPGHWSPKAERLVRETASYQIVARIEVVEAGAAPTQASSATSPPGA